MDDPTAAIALVVVLGVVAQWVATQFRIPSILLLLAAGLLAGPVTGLIDPDELLGDLLFPVVSMGVGLLLFEGGLGLHRSEMGAWRGVLVRLLSVGVLVTWVVGTLAAGTVGGMSWDVALLFGAIMTVTGPTVIIPLLRQARLRPRVARILRWEGICIDAVGATLAIVVLEVVIVEDGGPLSIARSVALTACIGIGIGLATAVVLSVALGRRMVPDHIQNAVIIVAVLGSFALANHLQHEAGLFAATALGIAMANQRRAPVRHVVAFQESLGVLLIGGIFVLLAARVEAEQLRSSVVPALGILAVLVLLGRPLAVLASTLRSNLTRNERLYLAGLAPRGIVAASVSALFGLRLEQEGIAGGQELATITFLVVAGTVLLYGPAAVPLSRRLRVGVPEPVGLALIGAPDWAIELGAAVQRADIPVLVVTTDEREIDQARAEGLLVYNGRLVHRDLAETVEALGVRMALAVSVREELNAFGADRFVELLGRARVYELPRNDAEREAGHGGAGGHELLEFGDGLTHEELVHLLDAPATVSYVALPRHGPEPELWRPLLQVVDGNLEVVRDGAVSADASGVVALTGSRVPAVRS